MKRLSVVVVVLSLAMMSLQGCYGKMALTKKVYALNGQVHDKFLRSLVTWAFIIVPVYGGSALVDFVLFNTIEFWSGNNPVAQGEKDFRFSSGGDSFEIHAAKSGNSVNYQIKHYQGQRYLDTLTLDWDIKSGNSKGTLSDRTGTSEYYAFKDKTGVVVTKQGPADLTRQLAALYR